MVAWLISKENSFTTASTFDLGRADNLLERVALKTGSLLGDMHWSHTGMPHSAVRHAGSTACPADAGTPSMAGRQIDGA